MSPIQSQRVTVSPLDGTKIHSKDGVSPLTARKVKERGLVVARNLKDGSTIDVYQPEKLYRAILLTHGQGQVTFAKSIYEGGKRPLSYHVMNGLRVIVKDQPIGSLSESDMAEVWGPSWGKPKLEMNDDIVLAHARKNNYMTQTDDGIEIPYRNK